MREIFSNHAFDSLKHYFYGNTEINIEALIKQLATDYPRLRVVGYEPSLFRDLSETEEQELCDRVSMSNADIVWIGLGAPRQEMLCARLEDRTKSLMIGVGGAFNILAGITPEAPLWMQDIGLEWLYRLIKEPKRLFKRYAVTNTRFLYLLAKEGCTLAE